MSIRTCRVCGKPLVRRETEGPSRFGRRTTCGGACRITAANAQRKGLPGKRKSEKPKSRMCPVCGSLFVIRDFESPSEFQMRITCGDPVCIYKQTSQTAKQRRGWELTTSPQDGRVCASCGKPLVRRAKEKASDFKARFTCGGRCRDRLAITTREGHTQRVSAYPFGWRAQSERIRSRDKNRCRLCGSKDSEQPLHVHHIDYDKNNCAGSNLVTLCATCHGLTNHNRELWRARLVSIIE